MCFMVTMLTVCYVPMRHPFCASESTHDVVNISDKRGSKRPKKPQNSLFSLGIAEQSDLRGGSMSPRLFLLQNRASLSARLDCSSLIRFFAIRPNFALFGSVGVLSRFFLQIATQGFLGAYTGIFTAEEKKE